jgi:hypothetical protein
MGINENYKKLNPIERWTPIRNHVFATTDKISKESALKLAQAYRDEGMLDYKQHIGLVTEIDYYCCKAAEHKLTPAADLAKTDFAGEIDNESCRIQVSSNKDIKLANVKIFEEIDTVVPYYVVAPKMDTDEDCDYEIIRVSKLNSNVKSTGPKNPSFSSLDVLIGVEGRSHRGNQEFFTELHLLEYDLISQKATLVDSIEGLGFVPISLIKERYEEELYELGPEYAHGPDQIKNEGKKILQWFSSVQDYSLNPLVYAEIGTMPDPEHYKHQIQALEILYSDYDLSHLNGLPFEVGNRDENLSRTLGYCNL